MRELFYFSGAFNLSVAKAAPILKVLVERYVYCSRVAASGVNEIQNSLVYRLPGNSEHCALDAEGDEEKIKHSLA